MYTATLTALVAAAAAVPAVANEAWDRANAEAEWQVRDAIGRRDTSEDDIVVPDTQNLLLGGNEDWKPYPVDCPSGVTWIRPASDGISSDEKNYISKRQSGINDAFKNMMSKAGLQESPRTPVLGLALSGGGYRAMINGLGMTQALMDYSESNDAGTGGWIDAMTYMAGLSGGSWATGSFVSNGGMLPTDLVNQIWNLDINLVFPADGKTSFYYNMLSNVRAKASEGFPTAITDYWSIALGNHLLPTKWRLDTSPNISFSDLMGQVPEFNDAKVPLPIIISAEREPGEYVIGSNATVWEYTPWEYGAWAIGSDQDKSEGMFTPIKYLGTQMNSGQPNGTCYEGFDQVSFILGTSSTLFNAGILQLEQFNDTGFITDTIKDILKDVSQDKNDIAQYPNPFRGYQPDKNPLANNEYLTMIDAGETNQNIPLDPLLMPFRNVDAILAFDNSADTTYSWPNGSSLWTTYQRALEFERMHKIAIRMPEVPSTNGFVNGGLNQRPVFFGCNRTDTPIIVYVPHYPWTAYSNSSTMQLQYDNQTALNQLENSMRSLTLNNTVQSWPKCLACAMSDRAYGYTSQNRSSDCTDCFNTWCWDGKDDSSDPSSDYEPVMGVTPSFLADKKLSNNVQTSGVSQSQVSEKAKDSAQAVLGASTVVAALGAAVLGAVFTVIH